MQDMFQIVWNRLEPFRTIHQFCFYMVRNRSELYASKAFLIPTSSRQYRARNSSEPFGTVLNYFCNMLQKQLGPVRNLFKQNIKHVDIQFGTVWSRSEVYLYNIFIDSSEPFGTVLRHSTAQIFMYSSDLFGTILKYL